MYNCAPVAVIPPLALAWRSPHKNFLIYIMKHDTIRMMCDEFLFGPEN